MQGMRNDRTEHSLWFHKRAASVPYHMLNRNNTKGKGGM